MPGSAFCYMEPDPKISMEYCLKDTTLLWQITATLVEEYILLRMQQRSTSTHQRMTDIKREMAMLHSYMKKYTLSVVIQTMSDMHLSVRFYWEDISGHLMVQQGWKMANLHLQTGNERNLFR